jgi:hypothetical protein
MSLKARVDHFPFAFGPLIETQSRKAALRTDNRVRPVLSAILFKSMVLAISINWRSAAKVRLNLGFLTALKPSWPSARVRLGGRSFQIHHGRQDWLTGRNDLFRRRVKSDS